MAATAASAEQYVAFRWKRILITLKSCQRQARMKPANVSSTAVAANLHVPWAGYRKINQVSDCGQFNFEQRFREVPQAVAEYELHRRRTRPSSSIKF